MSLVCGANDVVRTTRPQIDAFAANFEHAASAAWSRRPARGHGHLSRRWASCFRCGRGRASAWTRGTCRPSLRRALALSRALTGRVCLDLAGQLGHPATARTSPPTPSIPRTPDTAARHTRAGRGDICELGGTDLENSNPEEVAVLERPHHHRERTSWRSPTWTGATTPSTQTPDGRSQEPVRRADRARDAGPLLRRRHWCRLRPRAHRGPAPHPRGSSSSARWRSATRSPPRKMRGPGQGTARPGPGGTTEMARGQTTGRTSSCCGP